MSSDEDNCTLSRLESLPTIAIDIIGRHLGPADLKCLRATSVTMHDNLDFSLREVFRKIQCPLQPPDYDALKIFKEQPLARAVETLIWKTSDCICWIRHVHCLHQPDITSLQKMVVDSVNWLPNLRAVGLAWMPMHDTQFWKMTTRKIEKSLEMVFVYHETVRWGVYWSDRLQSSLHTFIRPYESPPATMDGWLIDHSLPCLGSIVDFAPGCIELNFKSLKVHGTIVNGRNFWKLPASVEELTLSECILSHETDAFLDADTSVRALNFCSCWINPQTRSGFQMILTDLRDKTDVERLRFEQVNGFAFDWDGDGSAEDDGSKIPLLVEELGVKEALTKMIDCVCVSERPPRGD